MTASASDRVDEAGAAVEDVDGIELRSVYLSHYKGELSMENRAPCKEARLSLEAPAYRVSPDGGLLQCIFNYQVDLLSDSGAAVGEISVGVALEFEALGETSRPNLENSQFVQQFIDSSGLFIAHPYFREALESMTQRLGLDPLIVGLVTQSRGRPKGVTVMERAQSAE